MQKIIAHLNFAKGFRGGERQTILLIEELSLHNYTQKLLVRENSELTKRCKNIKNLEIIEIKKPYILNFNKIKDATIIHAHETKGLQFAYFINLFFNIPYIVTRRVDNNIKNNFFNKLLYNNAKSCVVLSLAIKKTILKITKSANITLIPSAFTDTEVNKEKAMHIKKRFSDKFLIGNIAALDDKHKGQSIIIELAKKIQHSHSNIHFLIVGDGEDRKMFEKMAEGLENITFEGFVTDVNNYISVLNIFLFPSRNEGLGSILLDVINHNIPIIASNVGGIPEIIQNDKNGILFDIEDINSLEKIVLDLYKNKDKREQLALNAKKSIDKYSVKNMTQSYINLYEK